MAGLHVFITMASPRAVRVQIILWKRAEEYRFGSHTYENSPLLERSMLVVSI